MTDILGIHDGHNAAAALVRDGVVVSAVQEERLIGIKNQGGLPVRAIEAVLRYYSGDRRDLVVALNGTYNSLQSHSREEILRGYAFSETRRDRIKQELKGTLFDARYQALRRRQREAALGAVGFTRDQIVPVDHHTAHASAAYLGSPWREGKVLVLTADGCGDRLSATVSIGENGRLDRIASVPENDSLGQVYAMVTYLLGMVPLEHEYKLMGLAPYVEDEEKVKKAASIFAGLFEWDPRGAPVWRRRRGVPPTGVSGPYLRERLHGVRFDLVAAGLQRALEEMVTEWVRRAIARTGIRRVALGGGLFMNVRANQRILALPEVQALWIAPSCGDEMNSVGAALFVQATHDLAAGAPAVHPIEDIYFGEDIDPGDVERAVKELGAGIQARHADDVDALAAAALAEGHIVARVRGRMEFGARALGNRSILARPDDSAAVRTINRMIKSRDFWMPFAPSIQAERAEAYLAKPKAASSPHMMLAFDSRPETRDAFVAAQHPYDHTARPNEVTEAHNAAYHRLLGRLRDATGHPVVLNTSFNLHGFPVAAGVEDALSVFRHSGLRHMALGDWWFTKS